MGMSRSQREMLGVMSIIDGVALSIESHYKNRRRNKTVLDLCGRVHRATADCMDAFGLEVDEKDYRRMDALLNRYDERTFRGDRVDMAILTSAGLGMLDGIERKVTNPARTASLDAVERALRRLHRYFDRKLDRFDDYRKAENAIRTWNELAA